MNVTGYYYCIICTYMHYKHNLWCYHHARQQFYLDLAADTQWSWSWCPSRPERWHPPSDDVKWKTVPKEIYSSSHFLILNLPCNWQRKKFKKSLYCRFVKKLEPLSSRSTKKAFCDQLKCFTVCATHYVTTFWSHFKSTETVKRNVATERV